MTTESKQLSLPSLVKTKGKIDWLLLLMFVFINGMVLYNAVQHHPVVGYDAHDHIDYARIMPTRLPQSFEETREFFSPPLPYLIPSLANQVCRQLDTHRVNPTCDFVIGKSGQLMNVLLSLGVTSLLLALCQQLHPDERIYKLAALGMLGSLPVYYKTFAQFRGEPYLAFFMILLMHRALLLFQSEQPANWKHVAWLGLAIGGAALSRQWGFFAFPSIAIGTAIIWLRRRKKGWAMLRAFSLAAVIGFIMAGWFYLHLRAEFGSFSAFNKPSQPHFSFANQPPQFYRATGFKDGLLFRTPVRDQFANLLIPTFYSETWGDYWGYMVQPYEIFLEDGFYLDRARQDPIYVDRVIAYLGRVNLVSLLPSLVLFCGVMWGLMEFIQVWRADLTTTEGVHAWFQALLFLLVICSSAGYMWFLIQYRSPASGDTIKATYMIQVFVLLPLLAAEPLRWLYLRYRTLYLLVTAALLLVGVHNIPAMVTHFPVIGN